MSGTRGVWERTGMLPRGLSLVLSALLIATPVAGLAAADESNAAANAVLSVASDPAGASVYVDGQFVGETPLNVDRLSAGDHRVRVVKSGFLENGRIVNVRADKTSTVQVKLTPDVNASTTQVISGTGGGDGFDKKWLWIGLAGGGAVAAALVLANRNSAPNAGTVSVSPATALQSSTNVTVTASGANDPDGDPLTFSWNFGDGSSGSGSPATHVYTTSGTFTVTLTVSDGKKDATTTGMVTVRNLSATWRGPLTGFTTTTIAMTQSGTILSGSYSDGFGFGGSVSGTVQQTSPQVRFTVTVAGFQPFIFTGSPNSDVSVLTGVANESGFTNASWNLTRQ